MTSGEFRDHFAPRAAAYAAARPDYPPELFAWLAGLAPRTDVAWDCATGSGQAALALTAHFDVVVATDASVAQLAHARSHPRVAYARALAEATPLRTGCAALVTVAQALHWFDVDRFHAEARRVLAPGGIVAEWTYDDVVLDDPAADAVVREYDRRVAAYWPAERAHVRTRYRDLPFPFAAAGDVPPFVLERRWTADEIAAYLATWSATARAAAATGRDPLADVRATLTRRLGAEPVRVTWPLTVRVGRV